MDAAGRRGTCRRRSAPGITRVDNQIAVAPAEPHEVEPIDEMC
jgi:hypothetical protein